MSAQDTVARILQREDAPQLTLYSPDYDDQIVAIAREMVEASVFRDYPFDASKIVAQIAAAARTNNHYVRMVVKNGELYGGLVGHTCHMLFCDELMAKDVGWWIKRDRQLSGAALLLLVDFEFWAKAQGARKVFIGQNSGIAVETTTRLYEKCGYRIVGYNTVKDI